MWAKTEYCHCHYKGNYFSFSPMTTPLMWLKFLVEHGGLIRGGLLYWSVHWQYFTNAISDAFYGEKYTMGLHAGLRKKIAQNHQQQLLHSCWLHEQAVCHKQGVCLSTRSDMYLLEKIRGIAGKHKERLEMNLWVFQINGYRRNSVASAPKAKYLCELCIIKADNCILLQRGLPWWTNNHGYWPISDSPGLWQCFRLVVLYGEVWVVSDW